jgi:3'-phosphoadenosine 5'-phosphosulfate sulfotransferase (PAPS reductase)/FAD synthetase
MQSDEPIIVSYGGGVDSTAMLVGMQARGIRPALILFADTGAEKPGTYLQIIRMQEWCERVGFPAVTVVRYVPKRAPYTNLEEKCASNETLPSLAFGHHSCSLVFKRDPQNAYLKRHPLVREAIWTGRKLVKAIGYDAGSRDTARSRRTYKSGAAGDKWEAAHVRYWYPLQEWGWTRERCESEIRQAGLYVPPKSSCFFCPAMRPAEVIELRDEHPDLFARGVAMEERARDGRHGLKTTKGLGP